jgi:hypothetical protein
MTKTPVEPGPVEPTPEQAEAFRRRAWQIGIRLRMSDAELRGCMIAVAGDVDTVETDGR